MTATQGERPSAPSGEKPRNPAVRGEAAERAQGLQLEADQRKSERDRAAGVRAWIGAHRLATIAIVLVVLAAVAAGVVWWLNARHDEDTDDAFIEARPSAISAQVAAAITDVPVTDNEIVAARPGSGAARQPRYPRGPGPGERPDRAGRGGDLLG